MFRLDRVFIAACICLGGFCSTVPLAQAAPVPATPLTGAQTYVVQSGDYLSGIAAKLGVRLSDLLKANNLTTTSLILPGMRLVVPGPAVTAPAPAPAPVAAAAQAYVVKNGDYLAGIAAKLGVKLTHLLKANNLTTGSLIYAGMKLVVPVGGTVPVPVAAPAPAPASTSLVYVVRSGDYLSGIAQRLGVKLSALLSANRLTATSLIFPGMKLTVPPGGTLPGTAAPTAPAAPAPSASPTAGPKVSKVVAFALAQVGDPYRYNAAGPDSWDCSGLTMAAFAEVGISLPHYSGAQVGHGVAIDWRQQPIKPGDLVFLDSSSHPGVIGHVGIAVSATTYVHAPRSGEFVRVGAIPSRVVAVRRLLDGS